MRQVLITGASSDIGSAVCRRYLADDYRVIAHYHQGQPALFEIIEAEENVTPLRIDLSDPANLEAAIADDPDTFAACDVVVSAAALLEAIPFAEVTADDLVRAFTINTVPGIVLMRAIAPAMVERGWGRFVNLSSIGVKFGGGTATFCYALSKHAMEFLPADHAAWAKHNVLANTVRVGVTDTRIHRLDPTKDMTQRIAKIPAGRMATPDEIAATVHWLGSDANTFVTGQTLTAAGGE